MSKNPPESNSDKPPRVKLNQGKGNGNGNGDQPEVPAPENLPKPSEAAPPQIKLPKSSSSEATSPVDMSPTGISRPKDETTGIQLGIPKPAPSTDSDVYDQTMKIDLPGDAQTDDLVGTSRIDIGPSKPAGSNFDPFDSNQTMRINLPESAAQKPSPCLLYTSDAADE